MNLEYQKENDEVLKFILDKCYFDYFNSHYNSKYERYPILKRIEFIITPECNQDCKYCYFVQNKNELYPKELTCHKDIIHNLRICLDYIKDNNWFVSGISLFSGEIWQTDFGISILEIIYQSQLEKHTIGDIVIPSNCSFVYAPYYRDKIQYYIDKFKDIGVRMVFSASIDGKIIENSFRPRVNGDQKNDDFYDELFKFCKKNGFGLHPMVSAKSCKYWIENYKWFIKMFKKYDMDLLSQLMMLEVRNDDWDDDDIKYFKKFLKFVVKYQFKNIFNKDKKEFSKAIFSVPKSQIYNIISLTPSSEKISCSIQDELFIRLGDLSIAPCHRLMYKDNMYGKFIVDNEKIVGISSNNTEMAIKILSMNPSVSHLKCSHCKYRYLCMKGCLGSQYESTKEVFFPCRSVCKMQSSKIDYLISIYQKMGLYDMMKKNMNDAKEYKEAIKIYTDYVYETYKEKHYDEE